MYIVDFRLRGLATQYKFGHEYMHHDKQGMHNSHITNHVSMSYYQPPTLNRKKLTTRNLIC